MKSLRARLILVILFIAAIVIPWPTHGADCSGTPLSPRLAMGGVARVSYLGGRALILRTFAGLDARRVGSLPEGAVMDVLRGPICAEGRHWFQVQAHDGQGGWASEGEPGDGYVLEPWQVLVDLIQPGKDGYDLIRVNLNGLLSKQPTFPIPRQAGTIGDLFPPQEVDPLRDALATVFRDCPLDSFRRNPLLGGKTAVESLDADTGQYTVYPAPDSARLIIVRHLWLSIIGCDGAPTSLHGIDRVSLRQAGREQVLFDVPANGRIAGIARLDNAFNRVIDVRWSPDNVTAVAWVRYGERSRLIVFETVSGAVTTLDDGLYPVWRGTSGRLAWLRPDGALTALVIARPDGTGRQLAALPGELRYQNARLEPLWNPSGDWLLACVRADDCQTVAPLNIDRRRQLAALPVPKNAVRAYWIMADAAILWQPESGGTFTIQPLDLETTARQITVTLRPGESIDQLQLFPGGRAALVALTGEGARYLLLHFAPDRVTEISP